MDLNNIEQIIGGSVATINSYWTVLKWVYIFALGMYLMFSLVVAAQVKQMLMALRGGFDWGLKWIVWGNIGLAVLALVLGFVVL